MAIMFRAAAVLAAGRVVAAAPAPVCPSTCCTVAAEFNSDPWTKTVTNLAMSNFNTGPGFIGMSVEKDVICGGTNSLAQTGEATAAITVTQAGGKDFRMGTYIKGEAHFEYLTVQVDGSTVFHSTTAADGTEIEPCSGGGYSCLNCANSRPDQLLHLNQGTHQIKFHATTQDGLWNVGYFQVMFLENTLAQTGCGACRCANLNPKLFINDNSLLNVVTLTCDSHSSCPLLSTNVGAGVDCGASCDTATCCNIISDLAVLPTELAFGAPATITWKTVNDAANLRLTLVNKRTGVAIPVPQTAAEVVGTPTLFGGALSFTFVVPVDPEFNGNDKYQIRLVSLSSGAEARINDVPATPTEYPEAGVVFDLVGAGFCTNGATTFDYYPVQRASEELCGATCRLYHDCLGINFNAPNNCRLQVAAGVSLASAPSVVVGDGTTLAVKVAFGSAPGTITSHTTAAGDSAWTCRTKRNPGWAYDIIGYGACRDQDEVAYTVHATSEQTRDVCALACVNPAWGLCVGFNFGVVNNVNVCELLKQTTGAVISSSAAVAIDNISCFRRRDCELIAPGSVFNAVTGTCECGSGLVWFGAQCTSCNAVGFTKNGDGACVCAAGYTQWGATCIDINECEGANDCDVHATCTNTAGSYICACNTGFSGGGYNVGDGCTAGFTDMGNGFCRDAQNRYYFGTAFPSALSEPECLRLCSLRESCLGVEVAFGHCALLTPYEATDSPAIPAIQRGFGRIVAASTEGSVKCMRKKFECGEGSMLLLQKESGVDPSGNLVLKFEVSEFVKVGESIELAFGATQNKCAAKFSGTGTGGSWTGAGWSGSISGGCPGVTFSVPLNDALADCGITYDDSDVTSTLLTAKITATMVTEQVGLRTTIFKETINSVVVQVKLGTVSLVQSGQITVFGAVRPDVILRSVVFDASTEKMSVAFSTEVQHPYTLSSDQFPTTFLANALFSTGGNWPDFSPEWQTIQFAEDEATQGCPAAAVDADTQVCTQNWRVVLQRPKRCAELLGQDLDGSYLFDFTVSCRSAFTGACFPVGAPAEYSDVKLGFSTNSDDYCKRVIAELPLLGGITIYDENTYTNEQDTFVFGSTSYAKIELKAKAKIEHAHLEKVELRAQDCSVPTDPLSCYFNGDSVLLYTNPHLASADFLKPGAHAAVLTGAAASAVALSKFARTNDVDAAVTSPLDNPVATVAPNNSNDARVVFNFEWNSFTSPASVGQDASTSTRIYAEVRVKFVDQSVGRRMLLQIGNDNLGLQSSAQVVITKGKSPLNLRPVSASSVSAPGLAMLVMALLGALLCA